MHARSASCLSPVCLSVCLLVCSSVIIPLVNQSINQSINQPVSQPYPSGPSCTSNRPASYRQVSNHNPNPILPSGPFTPPSLPSFLPFSQLPKGTEAPSFRLFSAVCLVSICMAPCMQVGRRKVHESPEKGEKERKGKERK
ncbi:hypothetical protein IWZ03DRAFT_106200 [Phyllosticta citriasiana]|uniref:Uncharacterized protein n=1 Tax=Phyllosticta citriasiana TaxID=595635 RepID=A0ABR1KUW0_9PEZI